MWISVLTICSITPLICTTTSARRWIPDRYRRDRRRLPPPGSRWTAWTSPERVGPSLAPKPCCGFALSVSSGDFDEYWRFHEQCEYERNHASRYADGKVVPVKGRHLKRVK